MSDMTFYPTDAGGGVYGYYCQNCGQYVGWTQTHVCSFPIRIDHAYDYIALGNRFADLLERLVAALEKRDE